MTGKGLDEAGGLSGVVERVPQPAHRGIEALLEVDESIGRPQPLPQLVARHHLAGMLQEQEENLKRLLLEADPGALPPQLSGPNVHIEHAEP